MSKIPRWSLAKINAPIDTGLQHDKRLLFAHNCHDKHVVVLQHQKNDWVKCAPLGWDDKRISDWGMEVPSYLLVVIAEVHTETDKIQDVFNDVTSISQAKSKLDHYGYLYTIKTRDGDTFLYVPKWACEARYDINGELLETAVYAPAEPVSRG